MGLIHFKSILIKRLVPASRPSPCPDLAWLRGTYLLSGWIRSPHPSNRRFCSWPCMAGCVSEEESRTLLGWRERQIPLPRLLWQQDYRSKISQAVPNLNGLNCRARAWHSKEGASWRSLVQHPCSAQPQFDQAAQDCVQVNPEYPQGWRPHIPSGPHFQCLTTLMGKKFNKITAALILQGQ